MYTLMNFDNYISPFNLNQDTKYFSHPGEFTLLLPVISTRQYLF